MNKILLSGHLKGKAFLVKNKSDEPFLVGTLLTTTEIDENIEEVHVALLYDQSIAKIPYWDLNDGDHVYLSGCIINKDIPYENGIECNSWFKVESINAMATANEKPKKLTKIEKSLRVGLEAFCGK